MSAAYRPKGAKTYKVSVPTRTGWVKRSTGTRDKATARLYDTMLLELGPKGRQRWDLLDAVADNSLDLPTLFAAWRTGPAALDQLLATLADVDLQAHVPGWKRWLRDRRRKDGADRYVKLLAGLRPDEDRPWWRSSLTRQAVTGWLHGLTLSDGTTPASPGTKRRHAAALGSFVTYLHQIGQLEVSPLHGIMLPPAAAPKCEFLTREEVLRLVEGSPARFAQLFALLYGAGAEISAALAVRRRDVDLARALVRMPGTKSHNRDRTVIVATWARPWLEAACAGRLPDAPLFPGIDRHRATKEHRATLEALGIRPLKLHAARNHWAVRALRGGWSVEDVRRQLGHSTAQMVLKVYGPYIRSAAELERLEAQAEREAVRLAQEG